MIRAALGLLLTVAAASAADDLAATRKAWSGLDRNAKVGALMRLSMRRSPELLSQCDKWLKSDKDPIVRAQIVRVVAGHVPAGEHKTRAQKMILGYVQAQLALRRKRADREFAALHKKEKRKVPLETEMTAGADWKDPYDERRRKLPQEIKAERAHMREVLAAIESTRSPALRPAVSGIFRQHHDPEVVLRAMACFAEWKDWRALPDIADLLRIQQFGRAIGGGDVIGNTRYRNMRLKWDVYKDQLWWSRPEYLPRVIRPACRVASAITGATLASATEVDAWMLSNGAALGKRGVVLSQAFLARARTSQR